MKQSVRRFLAISGITITLGASGLILPAMASETPKIRTGISETKTSITIPIQDTSLKNTKVVIKIKYVKEKTDKTKTKKFVKTLDANGETTVTIKGLKANTQYTVSVQAKKNKSGEGYSASSKTKEIMTKK